MTQSLNPMPVAFCRAVMTTDEAADYLRICRRTLERWTGGGLIRRYDMRHMGIAGRPMWRYRKEDLDEFLLGPGQRESCQS
jgi:excisionase family DNA binding protein